MPKKKNVLHIVLVVSAVTALGCEASTTATDAAIAVDGMRAPDAGEPTLAVDAYVDTFYASLCTWFVRCEPKIGTLAFGETLCHPLRIAESRTRFRDLVLSGDARLDATLAQRCLDALRSAECNAAALDLEGCDRAFVGQVPVGGACTRELACADGTCVIGAECPGTCVAVAAGGTCATASQCEGDLGCIGGRCAARHNAGEACMRRTDCVAPLTCGLDGTCAAPPTLGEACRTSAGGDLCGGDFVCRDVGGSTQCAAGAAPGAACSGSNPCAPGGRCVMGACVATAAAGQPCTSSDGCIALHACSSGTCTALPTATLGGACTTDMPCVEGACVSGVCTLLEAGAMCDAATQFGECRGECTARVCQAPRASGADCSGGGARCEEGLACRAVSGGLRCVPAC